MPLQQSLQSSCNCHSLDGTWPLGISDFSDALRGLMRSSAYRENLDRFNSSCAFATETGRSREMCVLRATRVMCYASCEILCGQSCSTELLNCAKFVRVMTIGPEVEGQLEVSLLPAVQAALRWLWCKS